MKFIKSVLKEGEFISIALLILNTTMLQLFPDNRYVLETFRMVSLLTLFINISYIMFEMSVRTKSIQKVAKDSVVDMSKGNFSSKNVIEYYELLKKYDKETILIIVSFLLIVREYAINGNMMILSLILLSVGVLISMIKSIIIKLKDKPTLTYYKVLVILNILSVISTFVGVVIQIIAVIFLGLQPALF